MPLSMSVVMALAIAVSAAVAAIIAFVPTYQEGMESVSDTVTMLRANVIGRVDNGLASFFRGPAQAMSAVHVASRAGVRFGDRPTMEKLKFLCAMLDEVPGITTLQLYYLNEAYACDNAAGFVQAGEWNGTHLLTFSYDIRNFDWLYNAHGERTLRMVLNLQPAIFIAHNLPPMLANLSHRWAPAYAGLNTIVYSARVWIHGPNMSDGYLTVDVQPAQVQQVLDSLGLGARARVVVADGVTRRVIGNNWGEPTSQLLPNWFDFSLPSEERLVMFGISNLSDPLILRAYEFLGGDAGFYGLPQQYSAVMGSGRDRVFVEVSTVRDEYGIDVRVLLAMPELDFLEGTYRARDRTIAGVIGALCALIIVAIIFSILLTRPLDRLALRMYATASLQDVDEDDASSALTEIRVMQEAYTTMRNELNRMKVYLPQSVLQCNDEDEEGSFAEETTASHKSEVTQRSKNGSDTHSQTSRSSRASGSVRIIGTTARVAAALGHLNTTKSVTTKRIAMAVFNLVGFLDRVERSNRPTVELPALQAKLLDVVFKRVRENKGVIDYFQGDHIFASFNAVTTVASAPKRAALAALSVCADPAAQTPALPQIAVGVSGGLAHCGNMGNTDLARFNIVGPCCVEAMMLERLACMHIHNAEAAGKRRPSRILASGALVQDINLELLYLACDFVACSERQQRQRRNSPQLVVSVEKQKTIHMDEWNYALADASKRDPYAAINEAFHAAEHEEQQHVVEQLLNSAMAIPDISEDILEAAGRLREYISAVDGKKATIVSYL